MAISITKYLGINPTEFSVLGALDAILDVDSRFFIDPHLLKSSKAPELSTSYNTVYKLFEEILRLLAASSRRGDPFWRQAQRLFNFHEIQGLGIGYSAKGTSGRGMGPAQREKILVTAKEIVDVGIKDPEIFEIIGIFEEGVGADLISDMFARIILTDLLAYSQRIFDQFRVPKNDVPYNELTYKLPMNPFNRYPILLLPRDVLRNLPIARDWSEIDIVCAENESLRRRVNQLIGANWKAATTQKKSYLRQVLLKQPELLRDLIDIYKSKPAATYDFERDPAGEIIWYQASQEYVNKFPLPLTLSSHPTVEEVLTIVMAICRKFKDLVENNALSSLLYDRARPKREDAAQKLFYGIADAYCEANNLDLSREANAGRGPVDFKISKGYIGKVLVETKLSTNPRLVHGIETQIAEYQKAEKTIQSVYLVIDVGGSSERLKRLNQVIQVHQSAKKSLPEILFVDAKPKTSASKYRRGKD